MATVLELASLGELIRFDPVLEPRRQEFRELFASKRLVKWIESALPNLSSSWDLENTPAEQVDALLATYAGGDTLTFSWSFRPLRHIAGGVWEFKTADVRIFGWFHRKDCFIGHAADATQRVKDHNLYSGYAGEVARFRDALDLVEPKFVAGDNPSDVVSNFDLPKPTRRS